MCSPPLSYRAAGGSETSLVDEQCGSMEREVSRAALDMTPSWGQLLGKLQQVARIPSPVVGKENSTSWSSPDYRHSGALVQT
jgi:hypothetical protein